VIDNASPHFILLLQAFNLIDNRRSKEAAEKLAKERELAKVVIKKEDIETLVICSSFFFLF